MSKTNLFSPHNPFTTFIFFTIQHVLFIKSKFGFECNDPYCSDLRTNKISTDMVVNSQIKADERRNFLSLNRCPSQRELFASKPLQVKSLNKYSNLEECIRVHTCGWLFVFIPRSHNSATSKHNIHL